MSRVLRSTVIVLVELVVSIRPAKPAHFLEGCLQPLKVENQCLQAKVNDSPSASPSSALILAEDCDSGRETEDETRGRLQQMLPPPVVSHMGRISDVFRLR